MFDTAIQVHDVNKTSPCNEPKGGTPGSNWKNFWKDK